MELLHELEAVVAERDALRRQIDALRQEAGRIISEQSSDITKVLRDYISNTDDCSLRVRAAEEIEALRIEVEQWKATSRENKLIAEQMAEPYKRELAASQAREQQLREALHYSLGAWHYDGVSEEHGSIFQEASYRCDSPADTTALQSMIKKAGEVMRVRAAIMASFTSEACSDKILALPDVTLDDLK